MPDMWADHKLSHRVFVDLVQQMQNQCNSDSCRWFPDNDHTLQHHTLSVCGEVGEVANIVKKIDRGDFRLEQAMDEEFMAAKGKGTLQDECADVFIYLMNIANLVGFNLYEEYAKKRAVNEARWGNRNA